MRRLFSDAIRDVRANWKSMAVAYVVFKVITFAILSPTLALLSRLTIALTGQQVLADQDILLLFFDPRGWLGLTVIGAAWLAFLALELATLTVFLAKNQFPNVGQTEALRFAATSAGPVVKVTSRITAFTIVVTLPFLLATIATYAVLLREFDINFYLQAKPPEFWAAVGIGSVILVAYLAVMLRLVTSWFFAIPLVLYENVNPKDALTQSRQRATGRRQSIIGAVCIWLMISFAAATVFSSAIIGAGRFLIPKVAGRLDLLVVVAGGALAMWICANFLVNFGANALFAAMNFRLYLQTTPNQELAPQSNETGSQLIHSLLGRMNKTTVSVFLVIAVLISSLVGFSAINTLPMEDQVKIIAHRGSSDSRPENTLAAIQQAIDDGADWVEIDVQETADGQVVVFHDSDFMKLAGTELKIWNATLDDLQQIDIGSWYDKKFANERVPLLSDVLDICRGKIGVTIELKYYGHDVALEQKVIDLVESRGMTDEVIAMSLKVDAVSKLKQMRPDWKVGLLMSVRAGDLRKSDADFFAVNAGFANRSLVNSIHSMNKEIYVWTVNDPVLTSKMLSRGVDGIITDNPVLVQSVLKRRAEMSPQERLLVELSTAFGVKPKIAEQ